MALVAIPDSLEPVGGCLHAGTLLPCWGRSGPSWGSAGPPFCAAAGALSPVTLVGPQCRAPSRHRKHQEPVPSGRAPGAASAEAPPHWSPEALQPLAVATATAGAAESQWSQVSCFASEGDVCLGTHCRAASLSSPGLCPPGCPELHAGRSVLHLLLCAPAVTWLGHILPVRLSPRTYGAPCPAPCVLWAVAPG